jgi:hypothetical protein
MSNHSFAQSYLPDRAWATQSFIDEITKNYTDENAMTFDQSSITFLAKVPIRIHVVKNKKGANGIASSDIYNCISTTNNYFKQIGIQFYIDSVNYIGDYNYGFITYNHNKLELQTLYAVKNKINLFLVDSVQFGNEQSFGFTYFPDATDSNFIFLNKKYINGKYLTTLLGHFLGLLSTHETLGGAELADESNCATSGDFICDTYADPDLYNLVDTTCNYSGSSKDTHGKYFVPTVANLMSNSLDDCKCQFTPQQYRRMYYYYKKYRQNLK